VRRILARALLVGPMAMLAAAFSVAVLPSACAGGSDTADGPQGGEGGINLNPDGGGGLDPDAACAAYDEQAVSKPVNLYIMFDKSSSMAGSKWDAAKAGLQAFVDDPASAGIKVALRFFPRDPDSTPVCDSQGYKEPTVPYGALPGNAAAIKAAIDAEAPNGFSTPMYPALGGALLKGIEIGQNNPGESSAVLLVTDGQPQGPASMCAGVNPEDPVEIANLASAGLNYNPPVLTYVVGLPGVDQVAANTIAMGGGTDSAILVSNTNVQVEFQQALAKVKGDALPCEYEIPPEVTDGEITVQQVNIQVTPGDGSEPYTVPRNDSCNGDGDGWHYDNPDAPTAIVLCPDTCAALKSDLNAAIRVLLGCATVLK